MSHRVGALLMPAPAPRFGPASPDENVDETLDPAVAILGAFFKAVLERYCGSAWDSLAPKEPIVRVLKTGHNPEDLDFSPSMLPLLAVWREHDGTPQRHDDANVQAPSSINVLWVAPPGNDQKLAARSPFFNAFVKAMQTAYQRCIEGQGDPCYIRRGEEDNVVSRTYGSYVWGLAGIDSWSYLGTKRAPVQVGVGEGQKPQTYTGYLASWTILESTSTDPSQLGSTINGVRVGVEPTSIQFDLIDRAPVDESDTDLVVRQSGYVPPDT